MEKVPLIKKEKAPSFKGDLITAIGIIMCYLKPNSNRYRAGIRFK